MKRLGCEYRDFPGRQDPCCKPVSVEHEGHHYCEAHAPKEDWIEEWIQSQPLFAQWVIGYPRLLDAAKMFRSEILRRIQNCNDNSAHKHGPEDCPDVFPEVKP